MAKSSASSTPAVDVVRLLAEVADADTVYRDVYLQRARALLATDLPSDKYRGMRGVQQRIDEAVARSRTASMLQDWKLVHELATQADQLRRGAEATAPLMAVGEQIYDADDVAVDPFSPGMAGFAKAGLDL